MQAPTRTRSRIRRESFTTRDGTQLVVAVFEPDAAAPRGIVFIPPLMGGSYVQYYRQFGYVLDAGYRVVSFNYRGHHRSEGTFDVGLAFSDTLEIARWLRRRHPDALLCGIGTCFGSMPIYYALARDPGLFDRLVFINAIRHLRQTSTPWQALRIYLREAGWQLPNSLTDGVTVVLDALFPDIDKSPTHFGILHYEDVNLSRIAWQYLAGKTPRPGHALPVPALCCYGEDDALLKLDQPGERKRYEADFRRCFAEVSFIRFKADHYMTGQHERLTDQVVQFLTDAC